MTHIIFLAAGSAVRFGSNKLMATLNGRPVCLHTLARLQELTANRRDCDMTVVTRYPAILAMARDVGARVVDSPLSEQGLSYTIRAGLEALEPLDPADYLLFVVADQPWLSLETLEQMLDAAQEGCLAATASWQGVPGSPTLFSARLLPELKALQGDEGGRKVLQAHPGEYRVIEVRDGQELRDVDVPQDLAGDEPAL